MTGRPIRALLVDDEQPARERLAQLLQAFADVEVIGEAEDGEQAIERAHELRPDLLFLDIQMPGCSGLEVAASLRGPRPKIVFCTAFEQHAVDAFELHAVDYLLKPVSRARLAQAIERTREASPEAHEGAIDRATRAAAAPARFLAKRGARYHVVPQRDVLAFVVESGSTKLIAPGQHYWVQPTLAELEARVDPAAFIRISRGALVHLEAVREVVPLGNGQGEVLMSDGSRLEISRRRFKELIERLA